jgi:hypothetical protein
VIRLASALALVLALSACTPPATAPTPSASAGATFSPGAPRYRYQEGKLNLCERTDLAPTAPLRLTVKSRNPAPPAAGPGEACLFEAASPSGKTSSLRVEAVVLAGAADAGRLYKAQRDITRMRPDGAIARLGEEAEGFALQTSPGFSSAEYRVHLRQDNLVIEVWLAVGGDDFVPKATLKPMAEAVAAATLSTVDGAWQS